ncbi:helix-turn-helix domain-containing protein [Diaphorobacter caeni]|uniref:helix-turn-helix domain-containing protein n=1 Tax=Diaphorobacter caeni TaxID=2784387 RepID=UPI00188FCA0F|nr:helix-turn-helix domain-containing protein [Diaphorobacter caeni]MBF5006020.1 helix-turn-helix domain-containing protein [Diaphorobacter caeni]
MTGEQLKAWQARRDYTYDTAAKALGMGRTTYYDYLKKPELPRWLALACAADEAGIEPIGGNQQD